eukprot:s1068_g12.t1
MHPDNKSAAGDKDAATLPFQALGNVKEILLTPGLRILHDNRWGSSAPAPGAPLGASRAQHYREDEGPPRPIALHLPAPLHEMPLADTCEEADHFGNSMGSGPRGSSGRGQQRQRELLPSRVFWQPEGESDTGDPKYIEDLAKGVTHAAAFQRHRSRLQLNRLERLERQGVTWTAEEVAQFVTMEQFLDYLEARNAGHAGAAPADAPATTSRPQQVPAAREMERAPPRTGSTSTAETAGGSSARPDGTPVHTASPPTGSSSAATTADGRPVAPGGHDMPISRKDTPRRLLPALRAQAWGMRNMVIIPCPQRMPPGTQP